MRFALGLLAGLLLSAAAARADDGSIFVTGYDLEDSAPVFGAVAAEAVQLSLGRSPEQHDHNVLALIHPEEGQMRDVALAAGVHLPAPFRGLAGPTSRLYSASTAFSNVG